MRTSRLRPISMFRLPPCCPGSCPAATFTTSGASGKRLATGGSAPLFSSASNIGGSMYFPCAAAGGAVTESKGASNRTAIDLIMR